jgi:hypothetical protein
MTHSIKIDQDLLQQSKLRTNTGQPDRRIRELVILDVSTVYVWIVAVQNSGEDEGVIAVEYTNRFMVDLTADA